MKTKEAHMLVTINAQDLRNALKHVLPHAWKWDDELPVLNTIQLKVVDGYVTLTATDRHTLASQTITPADDGYASEDGETLIPRRDMKRLIRDLHHLTGTVAIEDDGVTTRISTKGLQNTFPHIDLKYPDWKQLLTNFQPIQTPFPAVGVQAKFFRRFGKVQIRIELGATPEKPLRITTPEIPGFVALIMPLRAGWETVPTMSVYIPKDE